MATSRAIDIEIRQEKATRKNLVKILLLGGGDAGKSTYLKQIKSLTGEVITPQEQDEYRRVVYSNLARGTQVVADAVEKLGFQWANPGSRETAQQLFTIKANTDRMTVETFRDCIPYIETLWNDIAMKQAYALRDKYLLAETFGYFLDDFERIRDVNYTPTFDDILRCRKPTKRINEHQFTIRGVHFSMTDVGGQRSQRQKWCTCFDGVTAIIYILACDAFDRVILEDRNTGVIVEDYKIFSSLVNNSAFRDASFVVFFNKSDLLLQKIQTVSIKDYFPEFEGNPSDFEDVKDFYVKMFKGVMPPTLSCFFYFTTALDPNNVQFTFNAVKEIVLEKNLKSLLLE